MLRPKKVKRSNGEQDVRVMFLTDSFLQAALDALGQTLPKGTVCGVTRNRLVIVGCHPLGKGYVYEVEVKDAVKRGYMRYVIKNNLLPVKMWEIKQEDYKDHISYVKNRKELFAAFKHVPLL